jgi:hypothetical protein
VHLPICPRIVLSYYQRFRLTQYPGSRSLLCPPSWHAFHLLSPICPRDHAMFWNHTCQLFMVQACTLHLLPLSIPVALLYCINTSFDTSIQFVTRHEAEGCTAAALSYSHGLFRYRYRLLWTAKCVGPRFSEELHVVSSVVGWLQPQPLLNRR